MYEDEISKEGWLEDIGEKVIIFRGEDFENVNPQQHYYEACLMKRIKPTEEGKKALLENFERCKKYISSFDSIVIPEGLKDLIQTTRKKTEKLHPFIIIEPYPDTTFLDKKIFFKISPSRISIVFAATSILSKYF